jgi:hypothetical protein
LLEAVIKKRLFEILQAGKDLAYAPVICKVWRLEMALLLPVVTIYKWSIYIYIPHAFTVIYSAIFQYTVFVDFNDSYNKQRLVSVAETQRVPYEVRTDFSNNI